MKSVLLCITKARVGLIISFVLTVILFLFTAIPCYAASSIDICCPEELNSGIFKFSKPPVECGEIAEIQTALIKLGFYREKATGIYDKKTAQAVKDFQQANSLKADGIFGQKTRNALSRKFDNFLLSVSTRIKPKGEVRIVINTDKKKLFVYDNNKLIKEYPVAVGTKDTPTPIGEWKIQRKAKNWGTGFGTRWMGLDVGWGIFGIHGTNKPWSIGSNASHGCIRMFNSHVEELYEIVKVGTPVSIEGTVYSPYYENRPQVVKGDRGSAVVLVQKGLIAEGYLKGKADGIFGQATEDALKKLQKDRGLEVTGQVDTDIWGILGL